MNIPFLKMNGAGNDFVIFDSRTAPIRLATAQVQAIAARTNQVTKGCDQLIVLEPSAKADVFMRIYNRDGSESSACGNATRCIAWLLYEATGKTTVTVQTVAGLLECGVDAQNSSVAWVNMGKPRFAWKDIPLAQEMDTLHLAIAEGPLHDPVGVSMGNPHAVFFVPDADAIDLATLGPKLEHYALFPQRANIGVAQVKDKAIRLRVWERGTGETPSCGTGACAALVAANRRGLMGRETTIVANGGLLGVVWKDNDEVVFQGPTEKEFAGQISL